MRTVDRDTVAFFQQEGGYAARPAIRLMRAERYAHNQGWLVGWLPDPEGQRDWYCECGCVPDAVLGCTLYDADGETMLAGLYAIGDPSPAYQRLVAAELALEAMDRERESIRLLAMTR